MSGKKFQRLAIFAWALLASLAVRPISAQILEKDAVTVPVVIEGRFDSTASGAVFVSPGGGAWATQAGGGNSFGPGPNPFKPGQDYTIMVDFVEAISCTVQFTAPPGYRVYLNDQLRSRIDVVNPGGYTNTSVGFKMRVETDERFAVGEASSLRPGRIVWTVGLGVLSNGATAGAIALRDTTMSVFSPAALVYDNASPEVESIKVAGVFRQIYATGCLVDIVTDNSTTYHLRFYLRDSGQIGAKTSGVYGVSGTPYLDYKIESPSSGKLRITRTVSQNGTRTTVTEMDNSISNQSIVNDWATSGTTGLRKTWNYATVDSDNYWESTLVGSDYTQRKYTRYSWGTELAKDLKGIAGAWFDSTLPVIVPTKTFTYDSQRVSTITTEGGGWTKMEYSSDFDSTGQYLQVYKPFMNSPAVASQASSSTGEVTTYSYAYDWTGRALLPASTETKVNNVLSAKVVHDYSSETLTDYSRNYQGSNAVMTLHVDTRKDYSDSTHYLTTVAKTFREDSDPEFRFFRGLLHSIKKPDGTMAVTVYFRGSYDRGDSVRAFTGSKSGTDLMKVTFNGTTTAGSESTSLTSYTRGDQTQSTESSFRIVPGISTAQAVITAADGTLISTEDWICTGTTSAPTWTIIQRDVNFYTSGLYLDHTTRDSGVLGSGNIWSVVQNTWTAGRLTATVDENGIRTEFTYDAYDRVQTKTRKGSTTAGVTVTDLTTTYEYDDSGRVLKETVSGVGTAETLVTSRTYDSTGRLIAETVPGFATAGSPTANPSKTTYYHDPVSRRVTATLPSGATRIEENYLDGRKKSVAGTGVVAEHYAYDVNSSGQSYTSVNLATSASNRKRETWVDMLGRVVKARQPRFEGATGSGGTAMDEARTYDNTKGWLTKTEKTALAPTLYAYNSMAQLIRSGLDLNGSDTLTEASTDRITDFSETFTVDTNSRWWRTKVQKTYAVDNSGTPTTLSTVKTRLTGRTLTLRSEQVSADIAGNETTVKVTVDADNKKVTTTTTRPGLAKDQVEISVNGLAASSTSHDELTTSVVFDPLGRVVGRIEPRTGRVTTTYHPSTTWVKEVTDAAGKRLAYSEYDSSGRVVFSKDANNCTTRTLYTARGEVDSVWGSGTYPVSYVYDDYGARIKQRTYRDTTNVFASDSSTWPGTGVAFDETTWEFDSYAGLLKKKTDAKGKFVEYDYNARGQISHRYWSRLTGSNRITATYSYFGDTSGDLLTGELKGISYNDSETPSVSYAYTRLGQPDTVIDALSTSSGDKRDFDYDSTYPTLLAKEKLPAFYDSRHLTRTYENSTNATTSPDFGQHTIGTVLRRIQGLKLGTSSTPAADLEFIYKTSNRGRVAGVVSERNSGAASREFKYGYEANSALLNALTVDTSHPFTVSRTFKSQQDLLVSVETKWNSATRTKFVYDYNDLRQRQSVVQSGDVFADYGGSGADLGAIHQIFEYNNRGELKTAATFMGSSPTDQSTPLSARKHQFAYDAIGNRTSSNTSGNANLADAYWTNSLNQYVARENNTLAVGGTSVPSATVAVGTEALDHAGRSGTSRHWGDNVIVDNATAPFAGKVKIFAAGTSSTGAIFTAERDAFLPPAYQEFTYDDDGNPINDSVWIYRWDAENRLIGVYTNPNLVGSSGPIPKAKARSLKFKYDYLGRRVQKEEFLWPDTATAYDTTATTTTRYLYDGWSVIAEFSVSGSSLTLARTYTWGLDIARTLTDAGGVGALLQIHDYASSGKDYFPAYDGNGNVAALFDADSSGGPCVAAYEYSPYGELLRCEGDYAKTNPYRFSTKTTDDETGLVYYGRRYYSPSQGRFLGRDPKEEKGGRNLYAFTNNNPLNRWDYLGMEPDYAPTYPDETATVLEEIGVNADGTPIITNVTYRAVRLADLNHQENGPADNDLIWIRDESGNRPAPWNRGMPEIGSTQPLPQVGSFQVGAVVSPTTIISPPSATPVRTRAITFRVGFDSSVTDTAKAIQGFNAQIAEMQTLFDANGLGSILLTYDLTGVTPTAPDAYDFSRLGMPAVTAAVNTQRPQVGSQPGVIPVLITNTPFVNAGSFVIGIGIKGVGLILRSSSIGVDLATLAHETGHVLGYVRDGGDPGSDLDRHSPSPTDIMYFKAMPNQNQIDFIYRNLMNDFAAPIR
ncbi:MAG: RHS repeat-associated core domain-containing protein [Verrucomicrobia bacterium]|nr:RHS repeat-associated core domain-containing protein [Verrucomicrobiota bacterium]